MNLSDLQNKKVVNLIDGKDIGNIIDVEIDVTGKITGLIVEKHRFLISYFSNSKESIIDWDKISKIGEDVILVNVEY